MIDAFEGTFGAHAGQRRNHTKGTCAAGEFVGTPDAVALMADGIAPTNDPILRLSLRRRTPCRSETPFQSVSRCVMEHSLRIG
jgi:hypothetical protein